ncbi:ATP-binding protein [Variovorax sp. KK3]|uniref:ATP-binding protein n=1 Tax=Variovorax sp. KK3 TaxID=1855728 RepID=UPI00097BF205|nr:ATP-binding protein [Variovorax sp. KK3]
MANRPSASPLQREPEAADGTIVWYAAADGAVVEKNPQWQAFTGQTQTDYMGLGWLDAVHGDDQEFLKASWLEAVRHAKPLSLRYRLRRHDGEYRHVVAQGAPVVVDGKVVRWVGFVVDATDSLQASEALRVSEERFRVLDEIGGATRHLHEADSVMAVTTRLLGQYLGATRCAYADVDSDSDRFTIRSDYAVDGVASSAGVYSLDLFGPKATSNLRRGRHLVVHDVDQELGFEGGAAMFNAIGIKSIICAGLVKDGQLVAMMAVHQAQPRHWTNDEVHLVSEVVDRCWAHIERVRDAAALREQDARKDEFIATLAHELRNPLAPIKYAVAIASREDVSPTRTVRMLGVIDRQVSLMSRLIDDLLDVSRINRGLIELQPEDSQLDAIVARALEATQVLMDARNHHVSVHVPPGIVVHVDPARMVQVIGNLLTNAGKYTPPGGRVELEVLVENDQLTISVRDNGLGIPHSELGRLFQMFSQLPHTRASAQGGLGLGLALVRKLVELHGGTVRAESAGLDQGSTFTVTLPLSATEPSAPNNPVLPAETMDDGALDRTSKSDGSPRVLVVEDNPDGRETLVTLLQGSGYEVSSADNGHDAIAAALAHQPHLVLLDLGLPGLDGYEVAKALRAQGTTSRLAIIALTGWGSARDLERTREAGFDLHLTKPVEPSELLQLVQAALRRLS